MNEGTVRMLRALGVNCLVGSFNRGGVPHERIMRSMRLFGEKVLPRLA